MSVRKLVALSCCAVGLSVAGLAIAQQKDSQAPSTKGQEGQRAQWQTPDHMLATCVAIANQEEVAIAKFAERKAQHKEVKEFAAMLIKDHLAFNQKLQKYAPEATQDGYLMEKVSSTTEGSRKVSSNQSKSASSAEKNQTAANSGQAASDTTASEPGAIRQASATDDTSDGRKLDFVQLHRELATECIESAKAGMNKKDGAEFDECFIGYQIVMHAGMKNKLTVFERHVSGDLKQVLAAGIETTEMHMKKAEQIMKKLADADSSSSKKARSDDSK